MITQANKVKVMRSLLNNFPSQNIKGAVKDSGDVEQIAFNTNEINHDQIVSLADLHCETQCQISLKRSGTGITIKLF
ncbi:hypothetical protein [Pedobacter arcticus]|uniref:hypothetical protein n=1 Tax=Pedobacter arcticus TaxID=752140 RepID=UPI000306815A|nr:hypothetical protein [Pedobacter arcticus]